MPSSRTKVRGFRITHTQNNLLNNPPYKGKANSIIRALLQLYFNKRIPDVDPLIEAEEDSISANTAQNLLNFKKRVQG